MAATSYDKSEREPAGAAGNAIEREGEEKRAVRSLGSRFPRLRSIPPPSLASLFPSSPPSARTPLRRSSSRARVCSSFDLSHSLSPRCRFSLRLARRLSSLSSDSPPLLVRFPFSLSLSTRVSSRTTGRSCNLGARARIYTRVLIIAEDGRVEERGENGLHVNAPSSAAGCRRSLSAVSSSSFRREGARENFTHRPRSCRGNALPNPENVRRYAPGGTFRNERTR